MANSSKTETLYTWNWINGGYNSCTARSRTEAIRKAREMSKPQAAMQVTLVPALETLRPVTAAEMAEIDRGWRSAFD